MYRAVQNNRTPDEGEDTQGYRHVKALVETHDLPPNTQLVIKQLSVQLGGLDETEIRKALERLVEEGGLVEIPEKGFFTKNLSSSEICTLYEQNKIILEWSLDRLHQDLERQDIVQLPHFFSDLSSRDVMSPKALTQITRDLFLHIVNRSGTPDLLRAAVNINERLNYIRLCECTLITFPEEELSYLCHLYHRKYIKQLRRAVTEYHLTRFKLIPRLMAIL